MKTSAVICWEAWTRKGPDTTNETNSSLRCFLVMQMLRRRITHLRNSASQNHLFRCASLGIMPAPQIRRQAICFRRTPGTGFISVGGCYVPQEALYDHP